MNILKKIGFKLQGSYLFLCLAEILLCVLYLIFHDTAVGSICADIAFPLILALLIVPFMPVSLFWNIRVLCAVKNDRVQRKKQLVLTIVSPILYILSWSVACIVFVLSTGGI